MAAPYGNRNAEIWSIDESINILENALELSFNEEYDFVGEICKDLKIGRSQINYIVDKYKKELQPIYNQILDNCEANCFRNAKKGKIKEATAIVNLKSNHKWTDRQNLTSDDGTMSPKLTINTGLTKEELKQLINK